MKITNLSQIKGITSLEELVKYDEFFRRYAKSIVTIRIDEDYLVGDDLVQEMYLKAHKAFERGKTIDGGYVFWIFKSLYINHKKKQGEKLNESIFIDDTDTYEEEDIINEFKKLEPIDNVNETIEEKEADELLYQELEERKKELTWYEMEILRLQENISLLQLSKDSKISYRSLIYTKNKTNEKLGITPKEKNKENGKEEINR